MSFLLLAVFAGMFSYFIEETFVSSQPEFESRDVLARFMGGAKEAVGDALFLKADDYFHGGAEAEYGSEEKEREDLTKEGRIAERRGERRYLSRDWITAVNDRLQSHEHVHLVREKQNEMLPFFAAATTLDPYNVEAVLTAAYWLDGRLGRTDSAVAVLEKGLRDNPGSWEIEYDLAKIYFYRKKDYAQSTAHFSEAVRKADPGTDPMRLAELTYFLGESLESQGKKSEALEAYRSALGFFKETDALALKETLKQRIAKLHAD